MQRNSFLKVLMFSNTNNCMTQRLALELKELGHKVTLQLAINSSEMVFSYQKVKPDIILCPFLTKKIPEVIYSQKDVPCIIVHPGIKGDRGISSLDWAIKRKSKEWGVTFIQAHQKMDAGAIWASKNFEIQEGLSKSNIYRTKVVQSAVDVLYEFLDKYEKKIPPEDLDYNKPDIKGKFNPKMDDQSRIFSWEEPFDEILQKILCSDSIPGTKCNINGNLFRAFGPKVYEMKNEEKEIWKKYHPGDIVGKKEGALLFKTIDNDRLLWISHLKKENFIKLPADHYILNQIPLIHQNQLIIKGQPISYQEIYCNIIDKVAYINFTFLNGAMNTIQCKRLEEVIKKVSQIKEINIIVLRGSKEFFSNGINLNTIEADTDPSFESLRNINALNDCIKAIFSIEDKITVSYLEGNAGSGGVMMALTCDFVYSKSGVVLNPHYKGMGLFGSEYWTYFLQKRVGYEKSIELTESQQPILARSTLKYGLIDEIIQDEIQLQEKLCDLQSKKDQLIEKKKQQRDQEWYKTLENHRYIELQKMKENFQHRDYHRSRKNFVFKNEPTGNYSLNLFNDIPIPKYIDCKKVADSIINNIITPKIKEIKQKFNTVPKIGILQVGNRPESNNYIEKKKNAFIEHNFLVEHIKIDEKTSCNLEQEIIQQIIKMNQDQTISGIILQLPIPEDLNPLKILEKIDPIKDIDGFYLSNLSKIALEKYYLDEIILPATVKGIVDLLEYYDIKVQGKDITIIGKGLTVGLPLTLLLMARGGTVTSCDIHTINIKKKVMNADIVICASNTPNIINADIFNDKTFVIDVGNNIQFENNIQSEKIIKKVLGNVKTQDWKAGFVTPVPGGVGVLTVTSAMVNCINSFQMLQKRSNL